MYYKTKGLYNNLIVILLAYILLYPVFEDLGIRWSFCFLSLSFLAMLDVCLKLHLRIPMRISRIGFYYTILTLSILLWFFFGPSRRDNEIISYMLVLVVCYFFALFADCSQEQIRTCSKILIVVAVILAFYVIFTHFFRNFYMSSILPNLPEDTRVYNNWLLGQGYGVPVGGSIVYADYVMCTAGIGIFSSLVFGKDKKCKWKKVIILLLFLVAIYLEGRRGELICFLIGLLSLFLIGIYRATPINKIKKVIILLIVVVVCTLIVLLMLRSGSDSRLAATLQNLLTKDSESDISTGRFARWKLALAWFKEAPLFGIGWGQYGYKFTGKTDIVKVYINFKYAHNDYLNVLCEMGIVGACILYAALILIFKKTIDQGRRLIKLGKCKKELSPYYIINSFCIGAQVFWAVLGFIDPVLYKQQFLCYFTLIIICIKSVEKHNRETAQAIERTKP